jgi:hypothetical protein
MRTINTRRSLFATGFASLFATLGFLAALGADEPRQASATPDRLVLFDGKSLAGWSKTDFVNSGEVVVEDGSIVMHLGGTMTGITTTRKDLPRTNYELTYEAQRLEGRDFFAAATFPVGKSYLTLVNGGWGGSVTGLSSINGSDASENETGTYVEYKNKIWYTFRVRVTDKAVHCWIDDKPVIKLDTEDLELGTRLETRAN